MYQPNRDYEVGLTYWDNKGWYHVDYFMTYRVLIRWLNDYDPQIFKLDRIFRLK